MVNINNSTCDMLGRTDVVSLNDARKILRESFSSIPMPDIEKISLALALNRIAATSVLSPEFIPPAARSTMDGYAVKSSSTFGATESLPAYLNVTGEVMMGQMPDTGPAQESCFKIATGGFLPPNTDSVIMLEHTVRVDSHLIEVTRPVAAHENTIGTGDDVCLGAEIISQGRRIRPEDMGILAGLGISDINVYKKPQIAVLSTGDELVPYTAEPEPGKIRDMNSLYLAALAQQCGAEVKHYGIVNDEEQNFKTTMKKALDENNIIIFSGSSSVGSRDLGEKVVKEISNSQILFHGVAIKPGKPVIAAITGSKQIFGLPGHPVSAGFAFEFFVRPAILHKSGESLKSLPQGRTIKAKILRNINSAPGRTDFVRVKISSGEKSFEAQPVFGKSSALSSMVKADGYLIIPEEVQGIYQGDIVEINLF